MHEDIKSISQTQKAQLFLELVQTVRGSHGLSDSQKKSLLSVFSGPDILDHLLIGTGGYMLAKAINRYLALPKTAQTLLNLAGFGIANILYDEIFKNQRHTAYDPETGKTTLLIGLGEPKHEQQLLNY
jgi:hypothetical protein